MKTNFLFPVITGLLLTISCSTERGSVSITDFGIAPDSRENALPAIKEAIERCRETGSSKLIFPKGRYDIWPSECDTVGLVIRGMEDFTVEGENADLVFHKKMEICRIDSCRNVKVCGLSFDWDRPFISQATIMEATPDHLDIQIDSLQYPYVIEDSKLLFVGEDWKMPVMDMYGTLYDKDKKEILYNSWDSSLDSIFRQKATRLENGNVRLTGKVRMNGDTSCLPEKGTYVSLYHYRYLRNGFTVTNSKDITLKDLILYHALSHGIVGSRTENITLDNFSATVNEEKGRVFSLIADASHFICCKGTILVENCNHTGQGDDYINVHGRNFRIEEIIDSNTVRVRTQGNLLQPGDTVWTIDGKSAQREETIIVSESRKGNVVSFTSPLPTGTEVGDILENKTWSAGLILRNCTIQKRHRARGVLATTPKSVIIENNLFKSAGTAILFEGDTDVWFESGACTDVQIRNNVFENCLTSGNRDNDRWQWGEAVITITPSHNPENAEVKPYHHNINIHDNVFKVFDAPIVHARSTGELSFENNKIIKTDDYKPYTWQKTAFLLEGCRNVCVCGNEWDENYTTRTVRMVNMKEGDLKTDELSIVH